MSKCFGFQVWIWVLCLSLETLNSALGSEPLASSSDSEQLNGERPNVVLIISDDQGYGDLGVHGNTMIRTPSLDQLARESFRLTNFHVDPTCAETRAALMTGRYACEVGVWHTIQGRSLLDPRVPTLADRFTASGYLTGIFGKWHLGDQYPLRPQDRGFQKSLVIGGGGIGQTPDAWGSDYFDPTLSHDGHQEKFSGYCTDIFFDHAIEFIEQSGDQPFFCYIPTNVPHGPYRVDPVAADAMRARGVPNPMAPFYAMIENFDSNVGRLLTALETQGHQRNTIVIFMTDNGTAAGVQADNTDGEWKGFDAMMRGMKGSQYDGGHRVPCFLRWPEGGIEPGESHRLTAHFDLTPTLIEWCQLAEPMPSIEAALPIENNSSISRDGANAGLAGRSLSALIHDQPWEERTLVVHSQRQPVPQRWHKTAVMTDRWRLIDGRELYDIVEDPRQANDVAAEHPLVVAELTAAYDRWWEQVSVEFDQPVRLVVGADTQPTTTLNAHDWHAPQAQVPWDQSHIRKDLEGSGYWELTAAQAGLYRITLRMRPEGVAYELAEGKVELQVGENRLSQPLVSGEATAIFEAPLDAGPFRLQSWVQEAGKPERGAYFVTVERL